MKRYEKTNLKFFVPVLKKGRKIDPHVSNLKFEDLVNFFFEGFRSTLKE